MRSGKLLVAFLVGASVAICYTGTSQAAKREADMGLQVRLDAVRAGPKEPRNHFNLGLEFYNRGMLDKAQDALTQALKVNPKDRRAHAEVDLDACQLLGDIALKRKDAGAAVKWFTRGLRIEPRDPVCLFGRGQAYYLGGKDKSADKSFVEFLEKTKGISSASQFIPQALTYLGALAMDRQDYEAAAGRFRQVMQEFPQQSSEAAHNLGLVLMTRADIASRKKDFAAAAAFYDEAVEISPGSVPALKSSGLAHYTLGLCATGYSPGAAREHFMLAGRNFERSLEIEPSDFEVTYTLGLTQYNLEDFQNMIDSYRKSVGLDPSHPGARFNLALALFRNRQFAEATKQAEEARRLQPGDKDTAQLVASIYDAWKGDLLNKGAEAYTADRILEALTHWRELLAMSPHDPEARQRVETAESELARRVTEHSSLGDSAYERGDIGGALLEWQKAAALDPSSRQIAEKLERIGIAKRADSLRKQAEDALGLGDYRAARDLIEEGLRLFSDNPAAKRLRIRIAKALDSGYLSAMGKAKAGLESGDLLAAKSALEQARLLDPGSQEVANHLQMLAKRIDGAVAAGMHEGGAAMREGRKETAIKAFEQVLTYEPANQEAARSIRKLTGKEAAVKLSAEKFNELYKQGLNAYLSNDLTMAEKAWAEALDIDPDNREVANYLERARLKLKKSGMRKS